MALSLFFFQLILAMCMSSVAVNSQKNIYEPEFEEWYHDDNQSSKLYHLTSSLFAIDTFVFVVFYFLFLLYFTVNVIIVCIKEYNKLRNVFNAALPHYFLVAPIVNMASHIDLIIIGFIQNPSCYCHCCVLRNNNFLLCSSASNVVSQFQLQHQERALILCLGLYRSINSYNSVVCVSYSFIFFFLIPINIAFDEAPNRLLTIYQSIIAILAAFLAYWVLLRFYRSPFDVLINVHADNGDDDDDDWNEKSDAMKENELAERLYRIIKNLDKLVTKEYIKVQDTRQPL